MGTAPTTCYYCDGNGNSDAGGKCGFCRNGKPLDSQSDWDRSWGKLQEVADMISLPTSPQRGHSRTCECDRCWQ